MKKIYNDPFLINYKILDLHGETRLSIKPLVNNFIEECLFLKQTKIIIVHGIGEGILRKEVHNLLNKNKYILDYKLSPNNLGITIVGLIENNK